MTYFLGMSTHEMTTGMWTVLREAILNGNVLRFESVYWDTMTGYQCRDSREHYLRNAAHDLAAAGLVDSDTTHRAMITDDGKRFYSELGPEYDEHWRSFLDRALVVCIYTPKRQEQHQRRLAR
jgi:hypothetical protein